MLKKSILMITFLFLLAYSSNDNYYSGYTRLEKPKREIVKIIVKIKIKKK